jgi:hypothetical protein
LGYLELSKGPRKSCGAERADLRAARRLPSPPPLERNLGQYLGPGYHGPWWTAEEIVLLGALPDLEVARRTGRPVGGVRCKRNQLGIPKAGR